MDDEHQEIMRNLSALEQLILGYIFNRKTTIFNIIANPLLIT